MQNALIHAGSFFLLHRVLNNGILSDLTADYADGSGLKLKILALSRCVQLFFALADEIKKSFKCANAPKRQSLVDLANLLMRLT